MNPHLGSIIDHFLRQDGALGEVEARAQKRVLACQLGQLMREQQVSKAPLAQPMGTSRSALDRLLDLTNASVTLYTMVSAVRALGAQLHLRLSRRRTNRAVPVRRSGRAVLMNP